MYFLIGILGALLVAALLALGGAAGWLAHREWAGRAMPQSPPPGERELERMREQQQAFRCMQNYSAERAYGMLDDEISQR